MDGEAQMRGAPYPTTSTSRQVLADIPFQELLDAAPDAIVIVDTAGRIVVVNDQADTASFPPAQYHPHVCHFLVRTRTRSIARGRKIATMRHPPARRVES